MLIKGIRTFFYYYFFSLLVRILCYINHHISHKNTVCCRWDFFFSSPWLRMALKNEAWFRFITSNILQKKPYSDKRVFWQKPFKIVIYYQNTYSSYFANCKWEGDLSKVKIDVLALYSMEDKDDEDDCCLTWALA